MIDEDLQKFSESRVMRTIAIGTFQGQWAKGMRHGYGVRSSAPFGLAAHNRRRSLRSSPVPGETPESEDRPEEGRGGFVLRDKTSTGSRSLPDHGKGHSLKALLSKTKRTSYEEELSDRGSDSDATDSSFMVQDEVIDGNVIETYMGEWKNDKRSGFGIAERSDGIKYEGEWYNNKKFGYGRTTFKPLLFVHITEGKPIVISSLHQACFANLQQACIARRGGASCHGVASEDGDSALLVCHKFASSLTRQICHDKFWELDDLLQLLEVKGVWVEVQLDLVGLLLEHCKNWCL
ncbi:Junctophilin-3 [Araneus ventricosus]|uniref:Junctophilin-3 n=1 Tax=Araneus ventricosus TaxID=182803 RepID=A0A4Y2KZ23_ARAVE|nr:Junctophilin-3 [Araneus ventricosus]